MPRARIHRIPTTGPDDTSGLRALIDAGDLDLGKLVAIIGKTEGNGCVNDFTRAFAVSALTQELGDAAAMVSMVMSGGTEGGLSPHIVTFEVLEDNGPGPALAIGTAKMRLDKISSVARLLSRRSDTISWIISILQLICRINVS